MSWDEINADPEFQSLPEDRKSRVKANYFQAKIAPNVPADKLASVRSSFMGEESKAPKVPAARDQYVKAAGQLIAHATIAARDAATKPITEMLDKSGKTASDVTEKLGLPNVDSPGIVERLTRAAHESAIQFGIKPTEEEKVENPTIAALGITRPMRAYQTLIDRMLPEVTALEPWFALKEKPLTDKLDTIINRRNEQSKLEDAAIAPVETTTKDIPKFDLAKRAAAETVQQLLHGALTGARAMLNPVDFLEAEAAAKLGGLAGRGAMEAIARTKPEAGLRVLMSPVGRIAESDLAHLTKPKEMLTPMDLVHRQVQGVTNSLLEGVQERTGASPSDVLRAADELDRVGYTNAFRKATGLHTSPVEVSAKTRSMIARNVEASAPAPNVLRLSAAREGGVTTQPPPEPVPTEPKDIAARVGAAGTLGPDVAALAKDYPSLYAVATGSSLPPSVLTQFEETFKSMVAAGVPEGDVVAMIRQGVSTGQASRVQLAHLDAAIQEAALRDQGAHPDTIQKHKADAYTAAQRPAETLVVNQMEVAAHKAAVQARATATQDVWDEAHKAIKEAEAARTPTPSPATQDPATAPPEAVPALPTRAAAIAHADEAGVPQEDVAEAHRAEALKSQEDGTLDPGIAQEYADAGDTDFDPAALEAAQHPFPNMAKHPAEMTPAEFKAEYPDAPPEVHARMIEDAKIEQEEQSRKELKSSLESMDVKAQPIHEELVQNPIGAGHLKGLLSKAQIDELIKRKVVVKGKSKENQPDYRLTRLKELGKIHQDADINGLLDALDDEVRKGRKAEAEESLVRDNPSMVFDNGAQGFLFDENGTVNPDAVEVNPVARPEPKAEQEGLPLSKEAATAPVTDPKSSTFAPKATGEITDVGQELWYNRRNLIGRGLKWEDVKELNPTLKSLEVQKGKVWPRPNYEDLVAGGMQPLTAHLVKQVYDSISTKPNVGGTPSDAQMESYVNEVARVKEAVFSWAKDMGAQKALLEQMAARAQARLQRGPVPLMSLIEGGKEGLLDAVYPKDARTGARWGSENKEQNDRVLIIGGRKVADAMTASLDQVVDALKAIDKGWPAPQEAWEKRFRIDELPAGTKMLRKGKEVTLETKEYQVLGKGWGGRFNSIKADGFKTREEAIAAAKKLATKKEGVDQKKPVLENVSRQGPPVRPAGLNVTPKDLMTQFGFRGVNYGNYTNPEERQLFTNNAYDALMDLSKIIGIQPVALSLNGTLGLAYGAQGRGGKFNAAAHFVPGVNEINLTKDAGAGAIAHEWFHALDHYFATQAGGNFAKSPAPYLTAWARTESTMSTLRPEIRKAFVDIMDAMTRRPETEAEAATRHEAMVAKGVKRLDYWLAHFRRQIEAFKDPTMTPERQAAVRANELKQFDAIADALRAGRTGSGNEKIGTGSMSYVSSNVGELRRLFKDVTGRTPDVDDVKALNANADHVKSLHDVQKNQERLKSQMEDTTYLKEAKGLEGAKGGKQYWTTNWELGARAFESYTIDRLAKEAMRNDYLASPQARPEAYKLMGGDWYPRGVERETINKAFDVLVSSLKTRETEKGMMVYDAAYHGSPHRFDKFTTENIGSGEGAQSYGWGLYFAGKEEVAAFYRNKLTGRDAEPVVKKNGKELTTDEMLAAYFETGNIVHAYDGFDRVIKFRPGGKDHPWSVEVIHVRPKGDGWVDAPGERPRVHGTFPSSTNIKSMFLEEAHKSAGYTVEKPGGLYKVELAPKQDDYLDWDKSISKQSEKVKTALKEIGENPEEEKRTGAMAYDRLIQKFSNAKVRAQLAISEYIDELGKKYGATKPFISKLDQVAAKWTDAEKEKYLGLKDAERDTRVREDKAASMFLHSLGIPGIRYADEQSRGRAMQDRWIVRNLAVDGHVINKFEFSTEKQAKEYLNKDKQAEYSKYEYAKSEMEFVPKKEATSNYVIFDDKDIEITHVSDESSKAYGPGADISRISTEVQLDLDFGGSGEVNKQLTESGRVDYTGKTVKGWQDMAEIVASMRHTKLEHLHFVFIKKGKVIAHKVITSKRPNVVWLTPEQRAEIIKFSNESGADTVYGGHNHPSGNPEPSSEDKSFDARLRREVKNYKGHVVTDHEEFSTLEDSGYSWSKVERGHKFKKEQPIYSKPISQNVVTEVDIAAQAFKNGFDGKSPTILYMDSYRRVIAVEHLTDDANVPQMAREGIVRNKATHAAIVAPNRKPYLRPEFIPREIISTVQYDEKNGAVPMFQETRGRGPSAYGYDLTSEYVADNPEPLPRYMGKEGMDADDFAKALAESKIVPGSPVTSRVTSQGIKKGEKGKVVSIGKTSVTLLVQFEGETVPRAVRPENLVETNRKPAARQALEDARKAAKVSGEPTLSVKRIIQDQQAGLAATTPVQIDELTLLSEKFKNMEKGARIGAREATRVMRGQMDAKIEEYQKKVAGLKDTLKFTQKEAKANADWLAAEQDAIRDEIVRYLNAALPLDQRGKFLATVKNAKTVVDLLMARQRIDDAVGQVHKKGLLSDIRKLVPRILDSPGVDVKAKQAIREYMADVELKGRSDATYARIRKTLEFMVGQEAAGVDVQLPKAVVEELDVLGRRPLKDMSETELEGIFLRLQMLEEIGRTTVKVREAVYMLERERISGEILSDLKPIAARQVKRQEGYTPLGLKDRTQNSLKDALNWGYDKYLALTPPDVVWGMMSKTPQYNGAMTKHFAHGVGSDYARSINLYDAPIQKGRDIIDKYKMTEETLQRLTAHAYYQQPGGAEYLKNRIGLSDKDVADAAKLPDAPGAAELYAHWRETLDAIYPQLADTIRFNDNQEVGRIPGYFPVRFEKEGALDVNEKLASKIVGLHKGFQKNVQMGNIQQRVGSDRGVTLDGRATFEAYMRLAAYKIAMSRRVRMLGEIVQSPEFQDKAGEFGVRFAKQFITLLARRGAPRSGDIIPRLDSARRAGSVFAIVGRLPTALVHMTLLSNAASISGPGPIFGAFQDVMKADLFRDPSLEDWWRKNDPSYRQSHGDDPVFQDAIDVAHWNSSEWWKAMMTPSSLRYIVRKATLSALEGNYRQALRRRGIERDMAAPVDQDAMNEARLLTRRAIPSTDLPHMFLAYNSGDVLTGNLSMNRIATQYKNFTIDRWSAYAHDFPEMLKGGRYADAANFVFWQTASDFVEVGIRHGYKLVLAAILGLKAANEMDDDDRKFWDELFMKLLEKPPFIPDAINAVVYGRVPTAAGGLAYDALIAKPHAMHDANKLGQTRRFYQSMVEDLVDLSVLMGAPLPGGGAITQVLRMYMADGGIRFPFADERRRLNNIHQDGNLLPDEMGKRARLNHTYARFEKLNHNYKAAMKDGRHEDAANILKAMKIIAHEAKKDAP